MNEQIGVRVRVTLRDGVNFEGWLYGASATGMYVSLDANGENIRYIPSNAWSSISYDHRASKASFIEERNVEAVEEAKRFDEELSEPVIEQLSRVDFNRVRRTTLRFRAQQDELLRIEHELDYADQPRFEIPPDFVFRLADNYAGLLDELERSGLEAILVEHSDRIQYFVSTDTVPLLDGEVVESREQDEVRNMISFARENNLIVRTDSGREGLKRITAEKVVPEETIKGDQLGPANLSQGSTDRDRVRTRRMRKVSVFGKVLLGGALAATNVSLGITAGVVAAVPTLGVGTVGAAAGLIASTYTGINNICDGLDKYASIIEADTQ